MVDAEVLREVLDVVWRGFCLAVEEGCDGYFVSVEFLCDFFEGDFLLSFGVEEGLRGGGKVGVLGCLARINILRQALGGWLRLRLE